MSLTAWIRSLFEDQSLVRGNAMNRAIEEQWDREEADGTHQRIYDLMARSVCPCCGKGDKLLYETEDYLYSCQRCDAPTDFHEIRELELPQPMLARLAQRRRDDFERHKNDPCSYIRCA